MPAIALGFLLGVLACQQLPGLPASGWIAISPLLLPILWRYPRWRGLTALALGLIWAAWWAQQRLDQELPRHLEGEDLVAEGRVIGLPRQGERGLRFNLEVERLLDLDHRPQPLPGRLRLTWYQPPAGTELIPGQRWRFTLRLKRAHGFLNPGSFDYEAWLFSEGIRATGYLRAYPEPRLLAAAPAWYPDRLRYELRRKLADTLGSSEETALIMALALGARQGISEEQWATLRQTGTNHLMAISGLHVGLVAGLAFYLGRRAWALSPWLTRRRPDTQAGAVVALIAAGGYALLAGFSLPTQRAFIMLAVLMGSLLIRRHPPPSQVLSLALLLVLLHDPLAVNNAGFWLSFAAVAIIFYTLRHRSRLSLSWARIHFIIFLGLLPLTLFWFGHISLISPLANLIAVPLVSLLVVPLVLLGSLCLAVCGEVAIIPLNMAGDLLQVLGWVLEKLVGLSLAWQLPPPQPWRMLAALAGVIILLLPRGFPARWLGLLWLLPVLWSPPCGPPEKALRFTLLDVGQGLAAVLRTREHVLVYDTGPRFHQGFDAGSRVVAPFLQHLGIKRLDVLVVSHGDSDHSGGLAGLLAQIPTRRLFSGEPERLPVPAEPCRAGLAWQWEGFQFEFLHPPADYPAASSNDRACVLKVEYGEHGILLSGDIEAEAEALLLTTQAERLRADLLIAPHHGSRSSSTRAFVAAVQPRYVLFATGYRNRFGFPRPEVTARYRAHSARLFRTCRHGAISFTLNADGLSIPRLAREELRRYWHD